MSGVTVFVHTYDVLAPFAVLLKQHFTSAANKAGCKARSIFVIGISPYKRTIQGIEHKEYSMQDFHFAGSSQPFQRIIGEAKTKVWEAPTKQKISAQAAGRKRRLRESVATLSMLTLL